ncbi:hypothetical protein DINM_005565 [Dirofilaria immitis]|nr:hypothetical protein [Dirofilaria immitis]
MVFGKIETITTNAYFPQFSVGCVLSIFPSVIIFQIAVHQLEERRDQLRGGSKTQQEINRSDRRACQKKPKFGIYCAKKGFIRDFVGSFEFGSSRNKTRCGD